MKAKRTWNIRKDGKGVSPVIATILMVAITVVLAAVLYVMVTIFMQGGGPPIMGSLYYLDGSSDPVNGDATFTLMLTDPENPQLSTIKVSVLDDSGDVVDSATKNWTHIVSDANHIKGGDRLKISVPGTDISGYEVLISATGYSNNFGDKIPD